MNCARCSRNLSKCRLNNPIQHVYARVLAQEIERIEREMDDEDVLLLAA